MKFYKFSSALVALVLSERALTAPVANPQETSKPHSSFIISTIDGTSTFSPIVSITASFFPYSSSDSQQLHTTSSSSSQTSGSAWNPDFQKDFTINNTCNASESSVLSSALHQAIEVSEHARQHLLRYGNSSDIFKKYFGHNPPFIPLGVYDFLSNGNKGNFTFGCQDFEKKCNSTTSGFYVYKKSQIVVCSNAYKNRLRSNEICSSGYTIAGDSPSDTWAGYILEQLLDIENNGDTGLGNYEKSYNGVIELPKKNQTERAVKNKNSLIYFALEAWAHDIAVPGVGCPGNMSSSQISTHSTTGNNTSGHNTIVVTSGTSLITLTRDNPGNALSTSTHSSQSSNNRVATVTSTVFPVPASSQNNRVTTVTSTYFPESGSSSDNRVATVYSTVYPESKPSSNERIATMTSTHFPVSESSLNNRIATVYSTVYPESESSSNERIATVTSTHFPGSETSSDNRVATVVSTVFPEASSENNRVATVTSTVFPEKTSSENDRIATITLTTSPQASSESNRVATVFSTMSS